MSLTTNKTINVDDLRHRDKQRSSPANSRVGPLLSRLMPNGKMYYLPMTTMQRTNNVYLCKDQNRTAILYYRNSDSPVRCYYFDPESNQVWVYEGINSVPRVGTAEDRQKMSEMIQAFQREAQKKPGNVITYVAAKN